MSDFNPGYLVNALIYSVLGIIVYAAAFQMILKGLPGDVWHELRDKGNIAVAIVAGAVALGVAFIIGSSFH